MSIPTWAILRAAGIPDDQHADVLRRAERMVEHWKPDGAREYVAITPEWSAWKGAGMLSVPKVLRSLIDACEECSIYDDADEVPA